VIIGGIGNPVKELSVLAKTNLNEAEVGLEAVYTMIYEALYFLA
jgi:hypothetical protein